MSKAQSTTVQKKPPAPEGSTEDLRQESAGQGCAQDRPQTVYQLHRLQLSFPEGQPKRRTGAGVAQVEVELERVERAGTYSSMDEALDAAVEKSGWFALFCVSAGQAEGWPGSDERVLLAHSDDLCEDCQYPTHLAPAGTYKLTLSMWDALKNPEALCMPCLGARMMEAKNRKLCGRDFPQVEPNFSNPYVRKLWQHRPDPST